jgi:hypothetical protein
MANLPVRLKVLLREKHWQTHQAFCREYDKAAKSIDRDLIGSWPSRAQFHRWLSGELKGLPYPHHCQVLETMLPGWTAGQLFELCSPDIQPKADAEPSPRLDTTATPSMRTRVEPQPTTARLADVSAVFPTRADFTYHVPPHTLFDDAEEIRAAGLSLNLLCQHYPDQRLQRLVENGARLHCLFLDPDGEAIQAREQEEGYTDRHLTTLTKLNIEVLTRLRNRLPPDAQDRLTVAVYDETVRFNIVLIDDSTCVMQPYMPQARGVDSPTFLIERATGKTGLYDTFEQVFTELAERSRHL